MMVSMVGPSKMFLVECRDPLKSNANFTAQDACLGDKDMLQVQRLSKQLLAMQATRVMNRKQKEINKFFPVVDIYGYAKHNRSALRAVFPEKHVETILCTQSIFLFVKINGMLV